MKKQSNLDPDRTLNELIALDPRFLPILNAHGLDTCCGGAHTLREAARLHGLDLVKLQTSLSGGKDA